MIRAILTVVVFLLMGASALAQDRPLVIAHRGASGQMPEHTRAAYELAIDQGADFIEPDLVMSRDSVLIVRHENEIGGTTDVARHPEFADRRTTKVIDGETVEGWFTEDFTLVELKTLTTRERLPALRPASTEFDGHDPILTFEEVVELARAESERLNRVIGVAPELKHPSYFRSIALPMEDGFVAVLEAHGLSDAAAQILVQCFEVETLRTLSGRIDAPLLQLMAASGGPADQPSQTYAAMATSRGLADIATYADFIGVETTLIEPRDAEGAVQPATSLIADAHAAGLKVVAWTFRAENAFLPKGDRQGDPGDPDFARLHGDLPGHLKRFQALGVDAVFTDFPGVAVDAFR